MGVVFDFRSNGPGFVRGFFHKFRTNSQTGFLASIAGLCYDRDGFNEPVGRAGDEQKYNAIDEVLYMENDRTLALRYLPIVHYDLAETIPIRNIGYTVRRESAESPSFPRYLTVPDNCQCVIEYAYYWDYDIEHMYDLEHIWVYVGKDGLPYRAEGSFHGDMFYLYDADMRLATPPDGCHVHAFCQPGKHAFLPNGDMFRIYPRWFECCNAGAGGRVLVGGPFQGRWYPTPEENERSRRYIRETYAFEPTMEYKPITVRDEQVIPWDELFNAIPVMIKAECKRLKELYAE